LGGSCEDTESGHSNQEKGEDRPLGIYELVDPPIGGLEDSERDPNEECPRRLTHCESFLALPRCGQSERPANRCIHTFGIPRFRVDARSQVGLGWVDYRITRAPEVCIARSTSANVTIDVSPGVVIARAPWVAPYSTASAGV
jgi:hypothetical protein